AHRAGGPVIGLRNPQLCPPEPAFSASQRCLPSDASDGGCSSCGFLISRSSLMRILLLSMPDSFEHTPSLTLRMPNGALSSLAGNVDAHHQVSIADLILAQSNVRDTVEQLVESLQPDLVGLSVMTFQRRTALRIIALIRSIKPSVRFVVGGYD